MHLVIDTETTGLTSLAIANRENYQKWPRLVQIAWILADSKSIYRQESILIRPENFEIPTESTKIHGIDQLYALEKGQAVRDQLKRLNNVMQEAKTIVGHNLNFDTGVIKSEAIRQNLDLKFPRHYKCTAHIGRKYIAGTQGIKNTPFPTLGRLHKAIFGFSPTETHDAKADTYTCHQIFVHLLKMKMA